MRTIDPADARAAVERAVQAARPLAREGAVASYIPALAGADPSLVGLALVDSDGRAFESGDSRRRFTMQSVSKPLALALAMESAGEDAVFSRVGKEPTGDPFNSIIRLETSERRKPFNPLINAGAIVVSSLLPGSGASEKGEAFRAFAGRLAGRGTLERDEEVFRSERETGARNRSIAWFLAELGLLACPVDDALEVYFRQCAALVDALDLARIGAVFALDGLEPGTGERLMAARTARVVKALMFTCGLYDESGEFGVDAGIPAKSGVGGGLMAAAPGRCGIGSYGPALDRRGNSVAGLAMARALSAELGLYAL
ncbi:MAG TPA: glutaminase A [Spirochaetales bacterium]|nr:glutaminase A [Spirochaetales bacterium]